MSIAKNLTDLKGSLPQNVTLVAVSKTKPTSDIMEAYEAGQRVFGENKVQEMVDKYHELPKDIQWHMIGHLQRNKVKYMAHFVNLIHGVDSIKTLKEINKQAQKHERIINCLLQVKIAQEESKFGFSPEEIASILNDPDFKMLTNIKIKGLMGMASFVSNEKQLQEEFSILKKLYDSLTNQFSTTNIDLDTLSMGMSGDYNIAIENGSTMIRVGSAIFGHRKYF